MAIERATFPRDAWSEGMLAASSPTSRAPGTTWWPRSDDEIVGYAGLAAAADQADVQTIAVAGRRTSGTGIGGAMLAELLAEAGRRGAREIFLEVRDDNPRRQAVYERFGFERIGMRRRYYDDGTDAIMMRKEAAMADAPLVLGIETSCDETGIGHRPRPHAARQRGRLQRGRARPVRRRGARGGQPGAPGGDDARPSTGPWRRPGCGFADIDAIAVTAGPGLAGALLVGVAAAKAYALGLGMPLYGVNHLAAHVAVDQLEHGPLPKPCIALLVSGGHSSLLLVPDVAEEVDPARGHHRRRGRRGVRQGGAGARPAVPRRPAHRPGGPRRAPAGDRLPPGQVPTTARSTSPSPA